jgi:hypothetical protein
MSSVIEPPLPPRKAVAAIQADMKAEGTLQVDATIINRTAQYEEMLSRIAILETLMAEMPKQSIGIGHNQPPPITSEDVQEIKDALATLKAQQVVPTAPDEARAAGSTLKKIGGRLVAYLDAFMMEASKSLGKEGVKRLLRLGYWYLLAQLLNGVANTVMEWLHHIPTDS